VKDVSIQKLKKLGLIKKNIKKLKILVVGNLFKKHIDENIKCSKGVKFE
jgi:hypothetical protein